MRTFDWFVIAVFIGMAFWRFRKWLRKSMEG